MIDKLNHLDLFSGIVGFALGLHWAGGFNTVGFCEKDPFCQKVIQKHFPGVFLHDNIETLNADIVRHNCPRIDIVSAGFPCQQVSVAGTGAGIGSEESPTAISGLWWEAWRTIKSIRPRWLLIENVPALRTRGADELLAALESADYSVWPLVVGAWSIGAPHQRNRVWIVGYANSIRSQISEADYRQEDTRAQGAGVALGDSPYSGCEGRQQERGGTDATMPSGENSVGNADCPRLEKRAVLGADKGAQFAAFIRDGRFIWPARPGEPQHEWEAPRLTQPRVGNSANGLPRRMAGRVNKIKALGNAVVPQIAMLIGRAIMEVEAQWQNELMQIKQ